MKASLAVLVAAFVVAADSTTAAVARGRHAGAVTIASRDSWHPGPDSARVATLLSSLASGDCFVCELIADQIGNFWFGGGDDGIGRFADADRPTEIMAAKDSLHGHTADARAIDLLVNSLSTDNACVRRVAGKLLGRSRIAPDRLAKLLESPSPRTREAAAYAIGVLGDVKSARAALEARLAGNDPSEAAMAVWALGEIEDTASVEPLVHAAAAKDVRVVGGDGRAREPQGSPVE